MTETTLFAVAGIVISLAFSYIPGLRDAFGTLEPVKKRLIMLAMLVLVTAGAYGLSCAGIISAAGCTKDGAMNLVNAFIAALVSNQAAYQISPLPMRRG